MANLENLLKRRYAPLVNVVAPEKSLAKDIPFRKEYKTGEDYRFPIRFGLEQGITRANTHTASDLNPAADAIREVASLTGSEIAGTAEFSYGQMSTLSATKGDSDEAYDQAVGTKILDLSDALSQHLDMDLLYGCGTSGLTNIGVVNAVPVASVGGVVTINLTRASFIRGFWTDALGVKLDAYTAGGVKVNTTTVLTVTGVDAARCRVQLTGLQAETNAIFATDVLHFVGSRTQSMIGIQPILENSTTMFGINAALRPGWKAVSYAVGGALNFDKVMEGLSAVADNGNTEGVTLYVTPAQWTDLMTDEAALRRHLGDEGNGKVKTGYQELEFFGPCGTVTIKTYRYLKQGIAIALPKSGVHRIGSTDITFSLPGSRGNEFFYQELPTKLGASIRGYTDQAVVLEQPFHAAIFTGVASTADAVPA